MCYTVDCEGRCKFNHVAAAYMAVEACTDAWNPDKKCKTLVLLGILHCLIPVAHCETCCIIASPRETSRLLVESCDARIRELLFWEDRPAKGADPVDEWVKYVEPDAGMECLRSPPC